MLKYNMSNYYNNYWKKLKHKQCDDFLYKWPCLKKYIPKEPNITIVDFGCGAGQLIHKLEKINPSSHYVGLDVSDECINRNKKKFKKHEFHLIIDGGKLPFKNNSVEYIISADSIEHVYDTDLAFKEFTRVLKPGGKIIITTPYHGFFKNLVIILTNNFDLSFDPLSYHIRFFTKSSLTKCLTNVGLIPVKYDYFGRFYPLSRGILVVAEKRISRKKWSGKLKR